MASRFFLAAWRPALLPVCAGVGLSSALALHHLSRTPSPQSILRCDAPSPVSRYQEHAKTPVVQRDGRVNPRIFRQISTGSIAGLLGGVAVSLFSKPLALLLGLLIVGVQSLESRGIHVVPYGRLQRLFKNANVRGLVQDNVAFKLSLGVTFALAAFAEF